jgi:hypothetical protein
MAHYGKVENGIVTQVIVAEAEFFDTFVDSSPGEWIQASYNTYGGVHYQPNSETPSEDQSKALRKNFPGIGWKYDKEKDAFIPLQPYPSWTLNEETCLWECPVPYPVDDKQYTWNETDQQWDEII